MRKIILTVLIILSFVPCAYAYEQTIIDLAYKNGSWEYVASPPAKYRYAPALVKKGVATKWAMSKTSAAGWAALGISMLYDAYKANPDSFPAMSAWLAKYSYEASNSKYRFVENRIQPKPATDFDVCLETAKSQWGSYDEERGFDTEQKKVFSQIEGGYHCGCAQYTGGTVWCDTWQTKYISWQKYQGLYTNYTPGECPNVGKTIVWWYSPSFPTQYDTIQNYQDNIPKERIGERWTSDSNNPSQNDDYEKAWNDVEKAARDAMKGGEIGDKVGDSTGKKFKEKVEETYNPSVGPEVHNELTTTNNTYNSQGGNATNIMNDTSNNIKYGDTINNSPVPKTGGGSDSGGGEPVCGAPPLPPCEVTGNWNDSQASPGSLADLYNDPTENETVVGNSETELTEQKGILNALLTQMWTSVQGLVSKIMAEIDKYIGDMSGGTCSISSVSVFGSAGSFGLDFCPIDLSGWRQVIIAVFGMLSAIIVIRMR